MSVADNWNCVVWNAHSFTSPDKHAQVELLLPHISIIAITESRLTTGVHINSFPHSIHQFGQCGIAIYSRVPINRRDDLHLNCTDALFVETIGPGTTKRIIMGVIYNRVKSIHCTKSTKPDDVFACINRANATGLPVLIIGDWNAHHTSWKPTAPGGRDRTDAAGKKLNDYICDNHLTVLNNMYDGSRYKPTHKGRYNDGTVIDLAITNDMSIFYNCITDDTSIHLTSDHYPITIVGPPSGMDDNKRHARVVWDTAKADWSMYRQMLNKLCPNTHHIISSIMDDTTMPPATNVERIWAALMQLINDVSEHCIKQRTVNTRRITTWFRDISYARQLAINHHSATRKWDRYRRAIVKGTIARDDYVYDTMRDNMLNARYELNEYTQASKNEDWLDKSMKIEAHDDSLNWAGV